MPTLCVLNPLPSNHAQKFPGGITITGRVCTACHIAITAVPICLLSFRLTLTISGAVVAVLPLLTCIIVVAHNGRAARGRGQILERVFAYSPIANIIGALITVITLWTRCALRGAAAVGMAAVVR